MTDSTTPSAPAEQHSNGSAEKETVTQTSSVRQGGRAGVALGAIAIALVIALGGGLYYHGHQQVASQKALVAQLQSQIDALKAGQSKEDDRLVSSQSALTDQLKSTEQKLDEQRLQLSSQSATLEALQSRVTTIAASDAKVWHLSEADFLVKWPPASSG